MMDRTNSICRRKRSFFPYRASTRGFSAKNSHRCVLWPHGSLLLMALYYSSWSSFMSYSGCRPLA